MKWLNVLIECNTLYDETYIDVKFDVVEKFIYIIWIKKYKNEKCTMKVL